MLTDNVTVPRYVQVTQWIWLLGMAVGLVTAAVTAALYPITLAWVLLGITVVQAGFAVPAALALPQRKRWARMVLMILAALSIGSLYSTAQSQAWASLVFNLVLGATLGFLQDPSVREFFGLPRENWLRRRVRGQAS